MEEHNLSGLPGAGLSAATEAEYQTHGAGCEWRGKDGFKRLTQISKSNRGNYRLDMQTWWEGDDKDPMLTTVCLGAESFDVVTNMLLEFRVCLDRFRTPRPQVDADRLEGE